MKCANCGAELQNGDDVKFCPYCGNKVEIKEETPVTMAGAIHGIAKTYMKQQAEKERYEREHAAEIEERERQKRKEKERKQWLSLLGIALVPLIFWLVGKLIGLS